LKYFQLAELIFDITVRFCDLYIGKRSRTHDQMVQAARSGKQNIAEGSQVSGTSKKLELKLTGVARASLEELRRDYLDYLRGQGMVEWAPAHPALMRFKARRCSKLEHMRQWVQDERQREQKMRDGDGSRKARQITSSAQLVANGALSLLNLCCYLLDRQIMAQAAAFEAEGGFTERLYRVRSQRRQ
jgi:four helix bundle suffix protein